MCIRDSTRTGALQSSSESDEPNASLAEMDSGRKDSIVTIAAVGLLAYLLADITHHAFGHGAACLGLGGRVTSLSSSYVDCSLRGAAIDLAGPLANLVIGVVAVLAARLVARASSATRLFCVLAAAFNLFWFALQLAFSAATRTDDWAWAMHQFHVTEPIRYTMIAIGALLYIWTVRVSAIQMAPFARPRTRAARIVLTSWLTAGAIACSTAALDKSAGATLLRHVLEQSLGLSIGLLFVPLRAAALSSIDRVEGVVAFSVPWVVAAAIAGAGSILFLGPGFAIAI